MADRGRLRSLCIHGRCRPGGGASSSGTIADFANITVQDFEAAREKALAVGAKKFFLEVYRNINCASLVMLIFLCRTLNVNL